MLGVEIPFIARTVENGIHRRVFNEKGAPPRSCTKIFMVRIKTEVPLFLIVFDLLFQMQAKSRSISKKCVTLDF